MRRFLPALFLSPLFAGVALAFALGMGQVHADWLLAALGLAVVLGVLVSPFLQEQA